MLAESVRSVARRLNFQSDFPVAGVGGMFRAQLTNEYFKAALAEKLPRAALIEPRFGPAIGAVLTAYRQSGIEMTDDLLNNLGENLKRK